MKKAIAISLCLFLGLGVALARPRTRTVTFETGTGTGGTGTVTRVRGYIDEVHVSVSDATSTGAVTVVVSPVDGTGTDYNLATNNVADEARYYPNVDFTSVAGAAQTSDQPKKYMMDGETITFTVTGSVTNVTWTCRIKLDDGK